MRRLRSFPQKCQTVGPAVRLEPLQAPPCATVDFPAEGLQVRQTTRPEGRPDQCTKGFPRALLKAAEGDAKSHPKWSRRELSTFKDHLYLKTCVSCDQPQTRLTSLNMHIFNIWYSCIHFDSWHHFLIFVFWGLDRATMHQIGQ